MHNFSRPAPAPAGAVRMHRLPQILGERWYACFDDDSTGTGHCRKYEHADFYPASALAEAKREIERLREALKIIGEGPCECGEFQDACDSCVALDALKDESISDCEWCAVRALAADRKEKP